MVNYGIAFKRPFTDVKKLVIGIVLQLIPIVNFLAFGYQLKCAKTAMEKKFELPEWGDWVNLFVKGLLAIIIAIIYMLPAIIVILIMLGIPVLGLLSQGNIAGLTKNLGEIFTSMLGGIILGGLLLLVALYILPAAIMLFVKNNYSFGSAFKFGEIFGRIFKSDYFIVWIVTMFYSVILMLILSIIPLLGGAISGFITEVTSMTLFGELYSEVEKKK